MGSGTFQVYALLASAVETGICQDARVNLAMDQISRGGAKCKLGKLGLQ
jgi:hypothetical protein